MQLTRLRLENNSIFNFIKNEILPVNFSEQITGEALVYDSSIDGYVTESSMLPLPTSNGRGWVFFDDGVVNGNTVVDTSAEQTSKVSVVGASSYTVNYLNGAIMNPDTVPTSVSYYWNYVSVISGWPGINPPPLPLVAISTDSSDKEGFQLGGGVKNVRDISFNVFATSAEERDDILETIHSAIHNRTINIEDYSGGNYLNYDGTFNTSLSLPLDVIGSLYFVSTNSRTIYKIDDWMDLNMYRGVVTGKYESLVD